MGLCGIFSCFGPSNDTPPFRSELAEIEKHGSGGRRDELSTSVVERHLEGEAILHDRPNQYGSDSVNKQFPIKAAVKAPSSSACIPASSSPLPDLDNMEHHPSVMALCKQERTFRALLDKANAFGPGRGHAARRRQVDTPQSSGRPVMNLCDPDLVRMSGQLLKSCGPNRRPGPEAFDNIAQLLVDLRSWLDLSEHPDAPVTLMYSAGESLAHAEHTIRSAGQVVFWPVQAVHALVALVQLYGSLMLTCHSPISTSSREGGIKGGSSAAVPSSMGAPLRGALVKLLIREDLVGLLVEVLELIHFDAAFVTGGRRLTTVLSAAIPVWGFLGDLVQFAGKHREEAGASALSKCMDQLSRLLDTDSTPQGAIPRLLSEPLSPDNLVVHLHIMQLMQQLFDAPRDVLTRLLLPRSPQTTAYAGSASFYVHHHLLEASRMYHASQAIPETACAELCGRNLRLLHSLIRSGIPEVLSAARTAGVLDLMLGELQGLLGAHEAAVEAEAREAHADSPEGSPGGDEDDEEEDVVRYRYSGEGDHRKRSLEVDAGSGRRPSSSVEPFSGKFEFCYDLNEDLERILQLEDELGKAVELAGFDYDDEGRQLLQRNEDLAAASLQNQTEVEADTGPARAPGGRRPPVPKLSISILPKSAIGTSRSSVVSTNRSVGTPGKPVASDPGSTSGRGGQEGSSISPLPSDRLHQTHLGPLVNTTPRAASSPSAAPPVADGGRPPPQTLPSPSSTSALSPSRFSLKGRTVRTSFDEASLSSSSSRSTRFNHGEAGGSLLVPSCTLHIFPAINETSSFNPQDGVLDDGAVLNSATAPNFTATEEDSNGAPNRNRIPTLDLSSLGTGTKSARGPSNGASSMQPGSSNRLMTFSNGARGRIPDSAMDVHMPVAAGAFALPVMASSASAGTRGDFSLKDNSQSAVPTMPLPVFDPSRRLIVTDRKVHLRLLKICLALTITDSGGLDGAFWKQYPLDEPGQYTRYNMEYLLTWHLNSEAGLAVVPELMASLEAEAGRAGGSRGRAAASIRLLRLMCHSLFDRDRFSDLKFQARGASGSVFRARIIGPPQQQVMIKSIDLPASCFEHCALPDIFSEVTILERYKDRAGICQIIDYGLAQESYWVVMKRYRCSLAEWRAKQQQGSVLSKGSNPSVTSLLLSILLQVVRALAVLASDSVVHFDLKCSNILIDPLPGVKDSELYCTTPPVDGSAVRVPFQVVLADFGEARSYRTAEEAFTVRNRGTEVYKSPEMLMMNQLGGSRAGGKNEGHFGGDLGSPSQTSLTTPPVDAAKAALSGAGLASDIWSLGCVAFELISGSVLFGGDYASVTHRVAFGGAGNLRLNEAERVALGGRVEVIDLVEWILARDPAQRPSLGDIEARLEKLII